MLIKILKILLKSLGVLVFALWTFVFLVSFNDGPTEIFPGGAFTSGELVTGEPDWSFAKNLSNVEFQTMNPVSSRTTFIMIQDNRVFIPSGYMTTWWGKIWKQWPYQAPEDGRAILRIDGKLYERTLVRITDDPALPGVMSELARKYGGNFETTPEMMTEVLDSDYLWIFELAPRS